MDENRLGEDELEQKLKDMPKVKDEQSKENIYHNIEPKLREVSKPKRQRSWVIPSLALIAAVALIFIFVRSSVVTPMDTANQTESSKDSIAVEDEKQSLSKEDAESSVETDTNRTIVQETQEDIESMLYYQDFEQEKTFTIAVADRNYQYAIPLTLIDSSSTGDPNDYYNRINSFVDSESLGVETFPFEEITFEFTTNNEQLYMTVPDDYQFPDGSSTANMFQQMLNLMFKPYGITEIMTQTDSTDQVDLGPYGNVESFELGPIDNLVYKLYQYEDRKRLLVPTSVNEVATIDAALASMQIDEEDFEIEAPIPEDTTYNITKNESKGITISFTNSSVFGDNEATMSMIEAILSTAKTFGYATVAFDIPIDSKVVGDYALNKEISVPEGVNPIVLH